MAKVNITLETTDVGKLVYLCNDIITHLTCRLNSLDINDIHYLDEKYSIETSISDYNRIQQILLYPDRIAYTTKDNTKTCIVLSNHKEKIL